MVPHSDVVFDMTKQGTRIEHIRTPPHFTAKEYAKHPEELATGEIATNLWVCDHEAAPEWKNAGK